jgi:hypothetical protein
MTTARRSWRGRSLAALAAGLTAIAPASISAHRLDEYLQAARIAIDPGRVRIELDLTPGMAVAPAIVAGIDRDRNGSVAADEGEAYAERVLGEIYLEVDGRPLVLELIGRSYPAVPAMLGGEGTVQLQLTAAVPPLAAGAHRVRYRNVHREDIGVYLANALVPASTRIVVLSQTRDRDQRELVIDYELTDGAENRPPWWGLAAVAAATVLAAAVLRRWLRAPQS